MSPAVTRILLVHDHDEDYLDIERLIQQMPTDHYMLEGCSNHDEAIGHILTHATDLVILHCENTFTQAKRLISLVRKRLCDTPIILFTNHYCAETDHDAILSGANDYIIKDQLDAFRLARSFRYTLERRDIQRQLTQQSPYDPLTGIANRTLFRDRLQQAMERSRRHGKPIALFLINLVGFKHVNETFGHDAGDELILSMSQRLASCMRRTDSIARIGADEFTVILDEFNQLNDLSIVAEKIIDLLAKPFEVATQHVTLSTSIGIATYPDTGTSVDALLRHADMAMRNTRTQRGSGYGYYSEKLHTATTHQLRLEADLRRALRRNEFELFYQPRVNLDSGDIVGIEALIRWRHPERGLLPPSEFIPFAEDVGLIVPMGYWTIQKACEDMKQLVQQGFPPLEVAVNVSFKQLQDSQFVDTVTRIVTQSEIDASLLELELTETAVMTNFQDTHQRMRALNEVGIKFSLDDFGTGYSSLSHIQKLPVSVIKIDRSFVQHVVSNSEDAAIVKAIINLAHNLKLRVIAEGVETFQQTQFLWSHHCDQIQGYYFSPAVRLEHLIPMLDQRALAAL